MTSTKHPNAQYYFERDVKCIQTFFTKRFGLMFEGVPILEGDVDKKHDLDKEVKASGCFAQEEIDTLDQIGQVMLDQIGKVEGEGENEQEENEDEVIIADITDKNNPVSISTIGYSNTAYTHQGWFTDDHKYFIEI